MASQQFCLRWNNYQSNLMQVFDQLLQTESFVDVTLSCEGQSIKAHRMVLSACSPYFQCLLSEAPCTHPVIILQGVKWPELKAVVEFMYKGEINICQEQLGSLLRVAESLKIRGLAEVDGDGAEPAVLTSPSVSPAARALSNTLEDSSPSSVLAAARKRRRYSGDDGSRPCTPMTPTSGPEAMETTTIDLSGPLIRSGMTATLPGSPLTSLAARLPGAMPPPAPMAPHLTHLPPLSPLLNMHSMPRPHAPDDFEIRPGIAEMIREEERRRRDAPDMAKLLESSHHWMGTSMADGGGPVFPTMFADPPINTVAADTAGVRDTTTFTTTTTATTANSLVSPQKPEVPTLLPPSLPVSVKQDFAPTSTWNTTELCTLTSNTNGYTTPDNLPVTSTVNHTSITTTPITTNTSDGGLASKSVFNTTKSQVFTISSTLTGGMRCVSPPPGTMACNSTMSGMGVVSPARSAGGGNSTTVEGAWDSLRGAISAPKSGASRWTQNDLMAALALVKAGTPIKPAAERCNIPVMTLWRRTRALGIVSSKVQCGFRYPAARRRSKNDHQNHTRMKNEPQLQYPVKTEHEGFTLLKVEPEVLHQPNPDVEDYLQYCGAMGKDSCVSRAGPLKEMSAVHASCRVASRESSPRPSGRENSPLFRSSASSPRTIPKETSSRHLIRENPMTPEREKNGHAENDESPTTVIPQSRPLLKVRENTQKNASQALSEDVSCTVVKKTPYVVERGGSPPSVARVASASSLGQSDRFQAWVDIVLEGADGPQQQQQQQDAPQDLTTHQRPPTSRPPSTPPPLSTNTHPSNSLVRH